MSGAGAPAPRELDGSGLRVGIVAAQWHETVMDGLLAGAQRALADAHVTHSTVIRVPGAFELPVAATALANAKYDAIVALAVVIRGGTPHFEYVCSAATDGLTRVAIDHVVPVGFGVLTCDTEDQALDRAGLAATHGWTGSIEDKGYEATSAAIETALVLQGVGA